MRFLRSLLKKELLAAKRKKLRKELAKMENPLDKDHMAGHTDNGPNWTQSNHSGV